jgi:integrase/recombinase XerD
MTEIVPVVTGIVMPPAAPQSVRDVDAACWDETTARQAAVSYWLTAKRSAHTKEAYERDIGYWFTWCDLNSVPVNNARRADVDAWREELTDDDLSPATVARRLCAVSSFYDYWLTEDVVERNPAKNATRPSISSAPVSIALTERQAALLVRHVETLAAKGDLRPSVIVRTLAETGMRIGELCSAKCGDLGISSGNHFLSVVRKGGETQKLAVTPQTRELITTYLNGRTDGFILYVQPTGRRRGTGMLDRSYARALLRRLSREAGLPPEVTSRMSPHVFRHSAATLMAEYGIPLHIIQQQLGHNHLSSTQRYIQHRESLDSSPTYIVAAKLNAAAGRLAPQE